MFDNPPRIELIPATPDQQPILANLLELYAYDAQSFDTIIAVQSSTPEYLKCQLLSFYRCPDQGDDLAALPHLENVLAQSAKAGRSLRSGLVLEAASGCARKLDSGLVRFALSKWEEFESICRSLDHV